MNAEDAADHARVWRKMAEQLFKQWTSLDEIDSQSPAAQIHLALSNMCGFAAASWVELAKEKE